MRESFHKWRRVCLLIVICIPYYLKFFINKKYSTASGLVKSNVVQTFGQVFSRNYIVWLIVYQVPDAKYSPGIRLLLFAWSITEVVRYLFYALQVMGKSVYLVTWLR